MHRKHLHALAVSSLVIGLLALLTPSHEAEAMREPLPGEEALHIPLPLPEPAIANNHNETNIHPLQAIEAQPWQRVTVRSGDNLSIIFERQQLSPQQLLTVLKADERNHLLTRLKPGQHLEFLIVNQELQAIRYDISAEQTLLVRRQDATFHSELVSHPIEIRNSFAHGVIESSLFHAGQSAGLSDTLIMELANIFGWDVDFALDIREGDSFSLVYEQHYLHGEKLRDGRILAAEFHNRGRQYRAVLFTDDEGRGQYYSPDGRSMRKAFLRSPVDFRRISSTFQRERYHPVLGERRPHRGVDYAAATGTPIKAAGDGKVIFQGTQGGYGKTVILQHGNHITTLYAHMSRFQKGVGQGSRVRQGDIIGYVGKTGLATGPHLHYEFRINGAHQNPLTVKLPDAQPISAKYRAAFQQQTQTLLAQLDTLNRMQVASSAP